MRTLPGWRPSACRPEAKVASERAARSGSRVFEPGEYLEPDANHDDLMVAGDTVPADLAVVDPGADAYGFELDVCVARGAGRLSCASQRVFE